jgi:hypothetical protein
MYRHRGWVISAVLVTLWAMSAEPANAMWLRGGAALIGDFDAGNETLATLTFGDGSTQQIHAGQGLAAAGSLSAGLFAHQSHQAEVVVNLGVKYSTMQPTTNANLSFVRVPLEVLAFYRNESLYFRAGAGLLVNLYTSLDGSGAASALQADFDPSTGGVIQGDFVSGRFAAGLRFTLIEYQALAPASRFAANSIGVHLSYGFDLWSSQEQPGAEQEKTR